MRHTMMSILLLISALNEINLTAQVTGYVTGIHFKDGDEG